MAHQGPAALGIAVVAMSEELGTAMAHRALEHLLQYGEPPVRSVRPLPPAESSLAWSQLAPGHPIMLQTCRLKALRATLVGPLTNCHCRLST